MQSKTKKSQCRAKQERILYVTVTVTAFIHIKDTIIFNK